MNVIIVSATYWQKVVFFSYVLAKSCIIYKKQLKRVFPRRVENRLTTFNKLQANCDRQYFTHYTSTQIIKKKFFFRKRSTFIENNTIILRRIFDIFNNFK